MWKKQKAKRTGGDVRSVERTSEKDRFDPHTLAAAGAPAAPVAAACGTGGACANITCLGSTAGPAISEVTDSIPVCAGRCG